MSSGAKAALLSLDSCSDSHIHSVLENALSTTEMSQGAGIEKKRGGSNWVDASLSHTLDFTQSLGRVLH